MKSVIFCCAYFVQQSNSCTKSEAPQEVNALQDVPALLADISLK
jgi:hypothetical protein